MSEFVTVTRRGLGARTKNSVGGAIFGFILLALGVILLFWNEGRAVKRYQDLKEGAGKVVSVDSASVDAANEGQLVHLSGEAKTTGPLSDPVFGISETAIRLSRTVEMFQWIEDVRTETKNNTGGSETVKKYYSYSKEWSSSLVDSSQFQNPQGHENPGSMKYRSDSVYADTVTLGAFRLPEFLVKKIRGEEELPVSSLESFSEPVRAEAKVFGNGLYFGTNPSSPEVGDMKVRFSVVRPGPVSVVAQQNGDSFVPYQAKTGGKLDLLESGIVPADQMFQMAHERNKFMTWAIRIGGYFMLAMGFSMILGPLAVFASILPFLGRIVETGTTFIGFLLAGIVWAGTVSIAWIFYRPILGIAILVIAVVCIVLIVKRLRSGGANTASSGDAPPPLDTPPPLT